VEQQELKLKAAGPELIALIQQTQTHDALRELLGRYFWGPFPSSNYPPIERAVRIQTAKLEKERILGPALNEGSTLSGKSEPSPADMYDAVVADENAKVERLSNDCRESNQLGAKCQPRILSYFRKVGCNPVPGDAGHRCDYSIAFLPEDKGEPWRVWFRRSDGQWVLRPDPDWERYQAQLRQQKEQEAIDHLRDCAGKRPEPPVYFIPSDRYGKSCW
jgi:hypothetical protein